MASSIRVLCVDDEPDLAELVASYLMDHADDIDARAATSGAAALEVLRSDPIDCVVCDYKMPEMDGLELLDIVREDHPDLPFILFTGRGSENVASEAVRAGVSDYIPKSTGTEQYELLTNRVRNLVERAQARRTTRELFNAANDAILVLDFDTAEIVDVNEAATNLWDLDETEFLGRTPDELRHDGAETTPDWPRDEPAPFDEPVDWLCERGDGSTFWAEVRTKVARIEGENRVLTIARDVTRRKQREERLSQLLTAANDLVGARGFERIGQVLTRTITDTLDFRGAVIVLRRNGDFKEIGRAGSVPTDGGLSTITQQAGQILGDPSTPRLSDGGAALEAPEPRSDGDLMYWPVGDHAVLACAPSGEELDRFTRDLIDLLLALSTTAVIRTFQDQKLANQHEELESLNRINEVIRDINQTLVKVSTRDEIESLVCKQLATAAPLSCTWIGEHDLQNESVHIRQAVGRGAETLEGGRIETGPDADDPLSDELRDVIERRQVVSLNELTGDVIGTDRAEHAAEMGYRSLTFVPVTYQNALYDILAIYAEEPNPFGDEQRPVLRELGETIGYAMHTAERSRALLSDTTVELEFEIRDQDSILTGLSAALDTEVELERIFFRSDDSARLFLRVSQAEISEIERYVSDHHGPTTPVREITSREDDLVVEVTVPELPMMKHLAEDMASIRSAVATSGEGRLVVEIPKAASVRTLTENLQMVFDDVALLARRQHDRDERAPGEGTSAEELGLTERQHEVLLTAYHAGFFSWPRESTGEEIAELLDISQPTFHEHLRTGERKVLETIFEDRRSVYT